MAPTSTATESYYLFGYPIAHSASPALHNYLFDNLGLQRTYTLAPATCVSRRMRALCHAQEFGGASVTMPLKVLVSQMLDRTTDEARAIGAVNTIVVERDEQGSTQLVGTNTDWLAVRNALLRPLLASLSISTRDFAFAPPFTAAALVIGGGGAARAAVYAVASVGCAPVYLVGRDARELDDVTAQFPRIPCIPISDPARASNVVLAVSCVPAVAPISPQEYAADACARAILASHATARPDKYERVFLDMCYKPRTTPLMLHAADAGWVTVSGIEAMLEQGFAQARMWLAKSTTSAASTELIPRHIEEGARRLIRSMSDIVVIPGAERLPDDDDEGSHQRHGARL